MIIRVVKMVFKEQEIDSFLDYFATRREQIRHFPGCHHLALWQDQNDPRVFFTYSHWNSPQDLETYRRSEFFDETWRATRAKFAEPAAAWTVQAQYVS